MRREDSPSSANLRRASAPTVLAVDDDDALRKLVVVWLSKAKLACLEARSGEEALRIAAASADTLDAIVLDVMMPGIDGFETLARLKASPETANISVLLLTAHATDETDVVRAVEAGAVDHVAKPFSGPVLVAKVRSMCEQTRAARELRLRLLRAEVNAALDPLTKLGNRRSFEQRLTEEAAYAKRHAAPFAVIIVDIDHFKSFNDTYGHEEGDRVLVHVADAMRGVLRAEDAAFRYGGEEFVLFLRASSASDAARVAERLQAALRQSPIAVGAAQDSRTIAFSAGVAEASAANGFATSDLVTRADAALYRAKRAGRDRVEIAD